MVQRRHGIVRRPDQDNRIVFTLKKQLCGREIPAEEAVRLVPLLFALCGKAQGRAAMLALAGYYRNGIASAGVAVKGFAVAAAADGESVLIVRHGPALAVAGGTISAGGGLQVDNQGRVIALDRKSVV